MKLLIICLVLLSSSLFSQRRQIIDTGFKTTNGQVKVAFFDADSTLRVSKSGSVSANSINDVLILPNVVEKLEELTRKGYFIAIVSNQGGVSSGFISMEIADGALKKTIELIKEKSSFIKIHSYDFAEGRSGDPFRKPNTGMGDALSENLAKMNLTINWKKSYMVGDSLYKKGKDLTPQGKAGIHFSNSDRKFAQNLGIPFYDPADFFGWRENGVDIFNHFDQVKKYNLKLKTLCLEKLSKQR